MAETRATLHMLCGKMASGKSTLARTLGQTQGAVVIAEDVWLSVLYGDEMRIPADYVRCAAKLRAVMGPHVVALLRAGQSVVLDFPANTVDTRGWMRGILDTAGAAHQMHVLDVPETVCLDRLRARNARGDHPFAPSEEDFRKISRHFAVPTEVEGFEITWHGAEV